MKKGYYILAVLSLIYLIFLTGRSAYGNWQTNQEIKKLKVQIETMTLENQNLQNQIAYFSTQSFREKEARRKLGLVKPDEKVVIISKESPAPQTPSISPSSSTKSKKANYTLWWEFFFKGR